MSVQRMEVIADVVGITFDQLQKTLELDRGRPLPRRTLYHWLKICCIERDPDGLYSIEDLRVLQSLVVWLKRPGASIERFVQLLIQWRNG